jgi:phytoene dehydrogenase-like protein
MTTSTKKNFDTVVVGSGISGMTMTLLLAQTGQKVLLLEQDRKIGGSMQRFKRQGVPFDTGFHFTAGFGNILTQMLQVMDIETEIEPIYFSPPGGARIFFKDRQELLCFPAKRNQLVTMLTEHYPDEAALIRQFFKDEEYIFKNTPTMDLKNFETLLGEGAVLNLGLLNEDFITLEDYFNKLGMSAEVRTVLSMFAMCHGTPPSEISFANHCRVSYGLHDGIAQVKNGGDAFIKAFSAKAAELDIEINCNCTIDECLEIKNRTSKSLKLSNGTEISCNEVVLAIHPREIAKILPKSVTNKIFDERVTSFDDTFGFFSLHAITTEHIEDFPISLTSCFSSADINKIMSENYSESGMAIMTTVETTATGKVQVINAFDAMWMHECAQWKNIKNRHKNSKYQAYKKAYADKIIANIEIVYPQLSGKLKVLETATILTFNDYLNGGGAAYGIKQLVGQFNLFGKLPLRNFYAVGQSSLLPGAIGAMLSSFIIFNKIVGNEKFKPLIKRIIS